MPYVNSEGPDKVCIYAVCSGHSLFIDIYYSIHWFCKRITKAKISLLIRACVVCKNMHKGNFHVLCIICFVTRLYYIWHIFPKRSWSPSSGFLRWHFWHQWPWSMQGQMFGTDRFHLRFSWIMEFWWNLLFVCWDGLHPAGGQRTKCRLQSLPARLCTLNFHSCRPKRILCKQCKSR